LPLDAAADEAAIEAVRVGALGKKGSVSALLATLGAMPPEERKSAGAAINGLKTEVTALIELTRPPS
jgi:phenylalanyl-tRNA synthetase alpha chain